MIFLFFALTSCGSVADDQGKWLSPYGFSNLYTAVRADGGARTYDVVIVADRVWAVSSSDGELEESSWNRMLVRRGWKTPSARIVPVEFKDRLMIDWFYREIREKACRGFSLVAVPADIKYSSGAESNPSPPVVKSGIIGQANHPLLRESWD